MNRREVSPLVDLPARESIRRILIMRWSAMGDVALASAAFEDVFRAFPGRELHLNTLPPWSELFAGDKRFSAIIDIPLRTSGQAIQRSRAWLEAVRANRYDLIIDLQSNDRSRILISLLWLYRAQVRWRLGNQRQFPYNVFPEPRAEPIHALDRMRTALSSGGIETGAYGAVLAVKQRHRERAQALISANKLEHMKFGVLLPGSQAGGLLKRWGHMRYAALARALHTAGVERLVLLGGPDDEEECRNIARHSGPWLVNLCGQTEVLDIVPFCRSARFVIANDTGSAHVAAAANRPQLVICGPTDPRSVLPAGSNVHALQADLPCINCYSKSCDHHTCMALVTTKQVVSWVMRVAA